MIETGAGIGTNWRHATADIPERGLEVSRRATEAELAAAAEYLDIPSVERLSVNYRIKPSSAGTYQAEGNLAATVVQTCGVTLEPVRSEISEAFEVEFRSVADMPQSSFHEQEVSEAVEHEPIENQQLRIGRIVLETLLAALPPFPRAEGAALERHEAGPSGEAGQGGSPEGASGSTSPFASLANWKPKPKT